MSIVDKKYIITLSQLIHSSKNIYVKNIEFPDY